MDTDTLMEQYDQGFDSILHSVMCIWLKANYI